MGAGSRDLTPGDYPLSHHRARLPQDGATAKIHRPESRTLDGCPTHVASAAPRTARSPKEHVWPDWLRDYLPPFSDLADTERYSPGTRRQRWQQPLLTTTVRAFCDGCNSGWMGDIEAAAKPMARSQPARITYARTTSNTRRGSGCCSARSCNRAVGAGRKDRQAISHVRRVIDEQRLLPIWARSYRRSPKIRASLGTAPRFVICVP